MNNYGKSQLKNVSNKIRHDFNQQSIKAKNNVKNFLSDQTSMFSMAQGADE